SRYLLILIKKNIIMGLFDNFITFLTEGGKKEGYRLWEGKSGSYIKKGGSGRKGKTISFFKKKK
ncbi:hypothetical protein, partial [Flavobacterium sp. FPG59]|uniref:hypothetical protein n=1 Tax=Flavobacterium sp. FPG59 TaxID=1929267 RepID=UPI001C3C6372